MPRAQAQQVVPKILEAFERNLSEAAMERLLSFASGGRNPREGRRAAEPDDARMMVQDEITDTLIRVVTWHPERVTLETCWCWS